MTEAKALIFLLVALLVVFGAVTVVCVELGASGTVLGLVFVLSCAAGGYFSSGVVMHFADVEERRKREEILLSR